MHYKPTIPTYLLLPQPLPCLIITTQPQRIGGLKLSKTSRNEIYLQMEVLGRRIKDNAKNTWTVKSSQYKTPVALGI